MAYKKSRIFSLCMGFIVFTVLMYIGVQSAATQKTINHDASLYKNNKKISHASDDRALYRKDQILFKLAVSADQRINGHEAAQQVLENVTRRHGFKRTAPAFQINTHAAKKQDKGKKNALKNIYKAYVRDGVSPVDAVRQLEADKDIEWAEPNYYRYMQATTPNDPSYGSQSHLNTINAPDAWNITTGSSDVVIAVVDTGVDWGHPDLSDNIWINVNEIDGDGIDNDGNGFIDDVRGWDFVSVDAAEVYSDEDPGPPDNDPMDVHGHGTHVSGIAGAVGNNGTGVTGVNWNVSLMPLRAGYKDAYRRGVLQVSDIADALIYAADNGSDIVNMSYGSSYASHTEKAALDYCTDSGVLLVAAAGNNGVDKPHYPAAFDNVLAVASVKGSKRRVSHSNYGLWVDVAAPGYGIYSTLVGGGYGNMTGTSMASPVVAGVAGLIKSVHPAWTSEQISLQLRATASPINAENPDFVNLLGAGLVAADQAVTAVELPARLGVVSIIAGSDDGWLDPGETAELRVSIKNFSIPQTGVSLSLTENDPYILIVDGNSFIGNLFEGRIAMNNDDPLSISIDSNVPGDYIASLSFEVSSYEAGIIANDTISLRLNPTLGGPVLIAEHIGQTGYSEPQVLEGPDSTLTLLFRSSSFAENHVYAKTSDPAGNFTSVIRISELPIVLAAREHHGAVDNDGRVHVVFMGVVGNYDGELFYTVREPVSGSWSTPVQLTTNAEIFDSSIYTTDAPNILAVDPQGYLHLVWTDYRSGSPGLYYMYFDGLQWSAEEVINTASADTLKLDLFFSSTGTGYLLWSQENDTSVYMMTLTDSTWDSPSSDDIGAASYGSVAIDTQDVLHMVYTAPSSDDVSYRMFDGLSWSAPEVIMQDTYVHGKSAAIAVDPADVLHVNRFAQPDFLFGDVTRIYNTFFDGLSWSPIAPLTFERDGTYMTGFDFIISNTGTQLMAGTSDSSIGHSSLDAYDIVLMSSDRDPAMLPVRPAVADDGVMTTDPNSLYASWSSSHYSGITEYSYAIGTAPGDADVRYWTSLGIATGITANMTDTPLVPYQSYYISVAAMNNNGYRSPVGHSDGIIMMLDSDSDGILDDGDYSGSAGDAPCNGGSTQNCDDNCADIHNPDQTDTDNNGAGNACDFCTDMDGDGYAVEGGSCGEVDCDDNNPSVHPDMIEDCFDGIDNNCSGSIDEEFDTDIDGYTTCNGDCNDVDPAINPGVSETCDDIDNNCDGNIDEGFDIDLDGYRTCDGDCDDADPASNPGAPEICDGTDNNCDGNIDEGFDIDADGHTVCSGDCNDADPLINPDACDIKRDGIDQDCKEGDRTKGKPCDNKSGNPEICDDGIDNDGDNAVDCNDADCIFDPVCSGPEVCDDGIDNDNDGKIDCADKKDCKKDPAC